MCTLLFQTHVNRTSEQHGPRTRKRARTRQAAQGHETVRHTRRARQIVVGSSNKPDSMRMHTLSQSVSCRGMEQAPTKTSRSRSRCCAPIKNGASRTRANLPHATTPPRRHSSAPTPASLTAVAPPSRPLASAPHARATQRGDWPAAAAAALRAHHRRARGRAPPRRPRRPHPSPSGSPASGRWLGVLLMHDDQPREHRRASRAAAPRRSAVRPTARRGPARPPPRRSRTA